MRRQSIKKLKLKIMQSIRVYSYEDDKYYYFSLDKFTINEAKNMQLDVLIRNLCRIRKYKKTKYKNQNVLRKFFRDEHIWVMIKNAVVED